MAQWIDTNAATTPTTIVTLAFARDIEALDVAVVSIDPYSQVAPIPTAACCGTVQPVDKQLIIS